jgi:hypothetical protein
MKTEKFSVDNKWGQTQFNEKMGKYGKSKLKKYCEIQSAWSIWCSKWLFYGWPTLGMRHYKTYASKKGQWADISSSN